MADVVYFPPKTPLRILLAAGDHDPLVCLDAILKEEGHEVRTLQDGASVRELVRGFDPDVCILDIEMPGKEGLCLARELRDVRIEDRPMLVAISGVWIRPSDRFLAIMVGFDHFFQKPADPASLVGVLNAYRDGRRPSTMQERVHLSRPR